MPEITTKPVKIGKLPPDEAKVLISQKEKITKAYLIIIVICLVLFFTLLTIIIGLALIAARRKELEKIKMLRSGNLEVYKIIGQLKLTGRGYGRNIIIKTNDYMLPEATNEGIVNKSGLRNYIDQQITFEFVPEIATNRAYYNHSGAGYNFIIKTSSQDLPTS